MSPEWTSLKYTGSQTLMCTWDLANMDIWALIPMSLTQWTGADCKICIFSNFPDGTKTTG